MRNINLSPKKGNDPLWKLIGYQTKNYQFQENISADLEIDTTSLQLQVQKMERNQQKNYSSAIQQEQLSRSEGEQHHDGKIKINQLPLHTQPQNQFIFKKLPSSMHAGDQKISNVFLGEEKLSKIKLCVNQLHREVRILKIQLIKQKQIRKIELKGFFKLVEQHIQEFLNFLHNPSLHQSLQEKIKEQDLQIHELKGMIAKLNEKSSPSSTKQKKDENKIETSSMDKLTVENLFKPKNTFSHLQLLQYKKNEISQADPNDKSTKKFRHYSKNTSIEHSFSQSNTNEKGSPLKKGKTFLKSKTHSFKDQSPYTNSNLKDKIDSFMEHQKHEQKNHQTMEEIAVLKIKISKLKESVRHME